MSKSKIFMILLSASLIIEMAYWLSQPPHVSNEDPVPEPTHEVTPTPTSSPSLDPSYAAVSPKETEDSSHLNSDPNTGTEGPSSTAVHSTPTTTVVVKKIGGRWVTQGDILVDESNLIRDSNKTEVRLAQLPHVNRWDDGIVPFEIDPTLQADQLHAALKEINSNTRARFVKRTDETDFVFFRRSSDNLDVCQSHVGRKGGLQELVLHPTCSKGEILHEMLHTLGFVHEHSREDRDQYITIAWSNIQVPRKNQFQMLPSAISIPVAIDFDFESVLLYPSNAFSSNGERTIIKKDGSTYVANRSALSRLDIQRVNGIY